MAEIKYPARADGNEILSQRHFFKIIKNFGVKEDTYLRITVSEFYYEEDLKGYHVIDIFVTPSKKNHIRILPTREEETECLKLFFDVMPNSDEFQREVDKDNFIVKYKINTSKRSNLIITGR